MASSAAAPWEQLVRAVEEQRSRLGIRIWDDRWTRLARALSANPRRDLDDSLRVIASYNEPTDVLLDVGGGAGRYSLPLALCCREVINIEPNAGMGAEFEAGARDARIANARWLHADWLGATDVAGDVALATNVVSFIPAVVPFLEKLVAASRRRVMIAGSTHPFWDEARDIFRAVYGADPAPVPEYRELLPVLWEMGIVPDVRVLGPTEIGQRTRQRFASRDAAIDFALRLVDAGGAEARSRLAAGFDDLFETVDGGFRRPPKPEPRVILTAWETHG